MKTTERAGENTKNKKRALMGAAFMVGVLLISIVYLHMTGELDRSIEALRFVDVLWVVLLLIAMLGYMVFGALAYKIIFWKRSFGALPYIDALSVESIGTFYGNLTPAMVAAFPLQVWRLTRSNLKVGTATGIEIVRFGMFQFCSVVLGAVLLIGTWPFFSQHYKDALVLNIVLFLIKLVQLVVLILISLFPQTVLRLVSALLRALQRVGLHLVVQHADDWIASFEKQVGMYSSTFKEALKRPFMLFFVFICSAAQLLILFGSPWFILRAFGISEPFLMVLTAGAMVQFLASSIPLPGGTGGVEASFALFFAPLFGTFASAGYLVWRLITYYAYTAICGCASLLHSKKTNAT